MRVNYSVNATPRFRMLSDEQCEEIFCSALKVLHHTGVKVHSPEILDLFSTCGVRLKGNMAYIPSNVVKRSLDTASKAFTVYGRGDDDSNSIDVRPDHIHYGLGSGCVNFMDPRTGERRNYTREDAATVSRVADALPNIDFVQPLGTIPVSPEMVDIYEFAEMVANTTKPIVTYSRTLGITKTIHKIAVAVAGGEEAFIRRPNFLLLGSPGSPLFADAEPSKRVVYCAEHHIPYISTSAVTCGATAPATLAGTLVQVVAEELMELVISQAANPGAPFLMGGVHSLMDMKSGILAYGAPEMNMLLAAHTEIARHMGLAFYSTAGCSDSKVVDKQAAMEGALSIMISGLSGANMIHDVGYIEFGSTGSLQQAVMMDEAIDMVKHFLRGIPVTKESMALDLIDRVGPGGQYLDTTHTAEHFKKEFWFPSLMDRSQWDQWAAGGEKTMGVRVQEKLDHILDTHKVPALPEQIQKEIDVILAEAESSVR
jgi:trimethylamine---corrinoid protein Co-methyltransferase